MPRMRTIHPRAPHDEDVASMTIWARYLWDRLPCYADREGRLEDRPLMLKGEVFPADDVNVNDLLNAFADRGFVIRYTGSTGRRTIQIVSFHDYQRPDRKERISVLPPPDGWAGDKHGTWVWDKTQGIGRECATEIGNYPVPLDEERSEVVQQPGVSAQKTDDDRPRARSGNPVIRLSGDPDLLSSQAGLEASDPDPERARVERLAQGCKCDGVACIQESLCDQAKIEAIAAAATSDLAKPREKIRPRTADTLEHCLRVAVEKAQPQNGRWLPGRFAAKDADECIRKLGDIEAALPELERKIELFAQDPDMQPWTVAKFADKYNAIGLTKLEYGRVPKAPDPTRGSFRATVGEVKRTGLQEMP